MWLHSISLSNFRNFKRQELVLPQGTSLFVGSNAQGKTSLLEAIFYTATFSSFQSNVDKNLIYFGVQNDNPAVARIIAEFNARGKAHKIEIRIITETNAVGALRTRKEVLVDGVKKSPADVIGTFTAVLFIPQMFSIMESGPEVRRRYLNLTLAQVIPGYARSLSQYQKILIQRNALLKGIVEKGDDASQLDFWNDQLVQTGSNILFHRAQALNEIEKYATAIHTDLSDGRENLKFAYLPRLDHRHVYTEKIADLTAEDVLTRMMAAVKASRSDELRRGITLIGPHRDDLRLTNDAIDLGEFGSRGQLKTALLSMKLAEYQWMKAVNGESPVVLLDEVTSEIDTARRNALLRVLGDYDQALLTATDADTYSSDFISHSSIYKIADGQILK